MPDEEFPTQVRMLAGVRVKSGDLRHFGRIPSARFQDQNPKTIFREVAGERRTASAGADNNEIVLRGLLFWMKRGVVHCRGHAAAHRSMRARMS